MLCKLFGHKLPRGYRGGTPYLTPKYHAHDGMGATHLRLEGECERCGTKTAFALMHLPRRQGNALRALIEQVGIPQDKPITDPVIREAIDALRVPL